MTVAAAELLQRFVLPLVAGGGLHVGAPWDATTIKALEDEAFVESEPVQQIELARQALARVLWLYPIPTPLDPAALALAGGVHNLLFLSHPDAAPWTSRRKTQARMVAFTEQLLTLPPPMTEEEALARHTLLANLTRIQRTDTEVEYWAATHRFLGQQPPPRLLRWPRLRQVQVRRQETHLLAEMETADQLTLLTALLSASPLTDLLTPTRSRPFFQWQGAARYLAWPNLCRLVVNHYLELGLPQVGPALAAAFWDLAAQRGPSRDSGLRLAAQLIVHLFAAQQLASLGEEPGWNTSDEPTSQLPSVLVAAWACGLRPPEVHQTPPRWLQGLTTLVETHQKRLGQSAEHLTQRLRIALAA